MKNASPIISCMVSFLSLFFCVNLLIKRPQKKFLFDFLSDLALPTLLEAMLKSLPDQSNDINGVSKLD